MFWSSFIFSLIYNVGGRNSNCHEIRKIYFRQSNKEIVPTKKNRKKTNKLQIFSLTKSLGIIISSLLQSPCIRPYQ